MTPTSLTVTGFLPFIEEVNINFRDNPRAVVSGSNGVGKSSLVIDGLLYSLFGESRQKPQWLINSNCDSALTQFLFEHKGNSCSIERLVERNKTPKIKLYIGNTDVTERTVTSTQEKINEFLGFSKQLLLSTCVAGQEQANIFSDMGPSDRERTLVQMLNLEVWENKKRKTGEWLASVKNERERINELKQELNTLQIELNNFYEQRDSHKSTVEKLTAAYEYICQKESDFIHEAAKYGEADRVQEEIERIKTEYKNINEWLKSYTHIPSELDLNTQLIKLNSTLDEVRIDYVAAEEEKGRLVDELTHIKKMESYLQAYKEHDINASVLDRVPCKDMNELYSSCELLEHARQSANLLTVMLESNEVKSLDELIQNTFEDKTRLESENFKWSGLSELCSTDIRNIKIEIDKTVSNIQIAKQVQESEKRLEIYSEQLKELHSRLSTLPSGEMKGLHLIVAEKNQIQEDLNEARISLSSIDGELLWRENKIQSITNKLSELEKCINEWSYYEDLQIAYREIPSSLLYDTVPLIEKYANDVLSRISTNHIIQLRIHKETKGGKHTRSLDLLSISPNGTLPFDSLSGSERFRESLSIRVALSRIITEMYEAPMNFFIVDESFGCLDQVNTSVVKDTLRSIADIFNMFYVITHVEDLKDIFDTEIIINRDKPQISIKTHEIYNSITLDN
jgi:DNA repair protein SbcC/Rad50